MVYRDPPKWMKRIVSLLVQHVHNLVEQIHQVFPSDLYFLHLARKYRNICWRLVDNRVFQKIYFSLICKCKQLGVVYGQYDVNVKRNGN